MVCSNQNTFLTPPLGWVLKRRSDFTWRPPWTLSWWRDWAVPPTCRPSCWPCGLGCRASHEPKWGYRNQSFALGLDRRCLSNNFLSTKISFFSCYIHKEALVFSLLLFKITLFLHSSETSWSRSFFVWFVGSPLSEYWIFWVLSALWYFLYEGKIPSQCLGNRIEMIERRKKCLVSYKNISCCIL